MYQRSPHSTKKIQGNLDYLRSVLREGDSLLDAGCCEGHLYDNLGHENYTGVDAVQANIDVAKRRQPEADFRCANIFDLEGKWDIVFCCRVLMHLQDYAGNVEKLRRLTAHKLLVCVPIQHDTLEVEDSGVEYRRYSRETIFATNPEAVFKHGQYSTVVYGPAAVGSNVNS